MQQGRIVQGHNVSGSLSPEVTFCSSRPASIGDRLVAAAATASSTERHAAAAHSTVSRSNRRRSRGASALPPRAATLRSARTQPIRHSPGPAIASIRDCHVMYRGNAANAATRVRTQSSTRTGAARTSARPASAVRRSEWAVPVARPRELSCIETAPKRPVSANSAAQMNHGARHPDSAT